MMAAQCHRPNGQHKAHVSAVTVCRKSTIDKLQNNTQSANDSIFLQPLTLALSFILWSLQIDAVSLFLLYLVEMICSGLQIIYNTDEVNNTKTTLGVITFRQQRFTSYIFC